MGKRSPAYMSGQKDMIVRAARDCMLENGLNRTSIRDICVRAGVSVGALYNHFKDRGEIVVAVYALDGEFYDQEVQPTSWATYVARLRLHAAWLQDRQVVKGLRLSYEFLAELIQMDTRPAGYEKLLERSFRYFRDPLAAAHAAGEITLPLGLDETARLHRNLCWGMVEAVLRDRRLDPAETVEEFIRGLGLLAGLAAAGDKRQGNPPVP